MAEKKGFDLSSLLRSAAGELSEERIEYLPFAELHEDPRNFYSLEGLDQLADNISLMGLMDPIRVRPAAEGGYTVISGHRRRAAIGLLIEGGEERWKTRVPCIVDRGETTAEFQELRLIFANANTRQRSSAEISKEAERVEQLLYALAEQGYDFPGRMRDHVAEAMQVSKTKLARLHAIRSNLKPDLLALYDAGVLNESAAYVLQQLPTTVQIYLGNRPKIKANGIDGTRAEELVRRCESYLHPKCSCSGVDCQHRLERFYQTATADMTWSICHGGCCLECSNDRCNYRCKRSRVARETEKQERKAKEQEQQAQARQKINEQKATVAGKLAAIAVLAREKGLKPDDSLPVGGCGNLAGVEQAVASHGQSLSDWSDAVRTGDLWGGYSYVRSLREVADALNVSTDFLLGRSPVPEIAGGDGAQVSGSDTDPDWHEGTPERDGRYLCLVDMPGAGMHEQKMDWTAAGGWVLFGEPLRGEFTVGAWFRLPPAWEGGG